LLAGIYDLIKGMRAKGLFITAAKAASGRWRVQGDIFVDKKPNIG
jgi:hypothetical protein